MCFMSSPLSEFLKNGKMDADFEVHDGYVIGLCVLYAQRTAKEQEYMIRDRSIVMTEGRELSACVQEAKDLACRSALSRIPDLLVSSAVVDLQVPAVSKASPTSAASKASQVASPTDPVEDVRGEEPDEPEKPTVQEERSARLDTVRQVGFADLQPASALLTKQEIPLQSVTPSFEQEDEAMTKAKEMKITILGKLHKCSGWTAGKILEEYPEVIVEFANRYNGPKTEERDALKLLYTEAMRRMEQAA